MAKYKKHSDYTTIIGIIAALLLVAGAIFIGGRALAFVDAPSLIIVFGGTFSVTIASFSWHEIAGMGRSISSIVMKNLSDAKQAATQLIEIAEHAKKNGLLGLQDKEEEVDPNSLLAKGIKMLVDGVTPDDTETVIKQDIESAYDRNSRAATILRRAAEIAPAMGLIGTLIGLVQMLGSLNDPSNIGAPMAIALLTTLYGALFAYMVLTPLASKIERNTDEELLLNKIYFTAIKCIGRQENPRKLQNLLNAILPPRKRIDIYKE